MKKYIIILLLALLPVCSGAQAFLGKTIPQIIEIHDSLRVLYVYEVDKGSQDSLLVITTFYYSAFCFINANHNVCLDYFIVATDSAWAAGLETVLNAKYKKVENTWTTPDGSAITIRGPKQKINWKGVRAEGIIYKSMFKP